MLAVSQPYWQHKANSLRQAAASNRAILVANILNAVTTYGFDGVDIDWEPFSASTDGPILQSLASDLRGGLGAGILTADAIVTDNAYWGSVQSYFGRVNVMTYDLTGTWNPYSWHNSALYGPGSVVFSVDLAANRFIASGVPASKLSIGIPFYGWHWTGGQLQSDPSQGITAPRQRWSLAPNLKQTYYQGLAAKVAAGNYNWDSQARVPYLSVGGPGSADCQFITYDNEQSVAEKVKYVKNNNLGGWIIWELVGDYLPSQVPTQPLLNAIAKAQSGSGSSVP
jgi:chitinase